MLAQVEEATARIALRLGVVGPAEHPVRRRRATSELYVIEANPRASRTVPFVSKAIGVPLAKVACRLMLGERLADMDDLALPASPGHVSVKEAVLPFGRFPRADSLLGPEMKSTGEVMGVAQDYPGRVRQGPGRRGRRAADLGHGVHLGHRRRQAQRHPARRGAARRRLQDPRHRRHRAGDPADGRAGGEDPQDLRGLAERGRAHRRRRRGPRDQHAHRLRRPRATAGRSAARRSRAGSRASPR